MESANEPIGKPASDAVRKPVIEAVGETASQPVCQSVFKPASDAVRKPVIEAVRVPAGVPVTLQASQGVCQRVHW